MKRIYILIYIIIAVTLPSMAQSDSLIHIYAVQQDEQIEIKPIHNRATHAVRQRGTIVHYTEFANEHSRTTFGSEARLYVTIPSSSTYTIDDIGICLFKSHKGHRYLVTKVANHRAARNCKDYTDEMNVTRNKINSSTYEMIISGAPGEYGLALYVDSSAGLRAVYDFSLLQSTATFNPKYSARKWRMKKIW